MYMYMNVYTCAFWRTNVDKQKKSMGKISKGAGGFKSPAPQPKDEAFDKAEAAKQELEKLVSTAVKEYEDDFQLKQQIKVSAKMMVEK